MGEEPFEWRVETCRTCKVAVVWAEDITSPSSLRGVGRIPIDADVLGPKRVRDSGQAWRVQVYAREVNIFGVDVNEPSVEVLPVEAAAVPHEEVWLAHWARCSTKKAKQWRQHHPYGVGG